MKDTGGEVKVTKAMAPVADSGGSANDGVIIDRKGYESCVFNFVTGAASGTPTGIEIAIKVEHGDQSDLSDAADLAGATAAMGSAADTSAANSEANINVNLNGAKRYVRLTETITFTAGTSPDLVVGASCALGEAKTKPPV